MKAILFISKRVLYFSRWCGKGYAIFAALGKEVRISELSIGICTKSLQKSGKKGVIITMVACWEEKVKEAFADEQNEKTNYIGQQRGEVCPLMSGYLL